MNSILQYLFERFPIHLAFILSLGYSIMLLGLIGQITGAAISLTNIILVTLSFLAFLLRLRITDEFKDIEHDTKNYPDRPFQRGAITAKQLISIGIFSLIIELGSLSIISPKAVIFYLPVLAYSVLTAKEFFISSWLNKHFTTYFISHQTIFLLFVIWGFMTFGVKLSIGSFLGAMAFIISMSASEIIRKLEYRYDKKGKIVKDSYPAVWGVPGTIATLIALTLCVGLFLTVVTGNNLHLLVALFYVLFTYSKNLKLIQVALSISLATQGILLFI